MVRKEVVDFGANVLELIRILQYMYHSLQSLDRLPSSFGTLSLVVKKF
jgi:hypothetical protein